MVSIKTVGRSLLRLAAPTSTTAGGGGEWSRDWRASRGPPEVWPRPPMLALMLHIMVIDIGRRVGAIGAISAFTIRRPPVSLKGTEKGASGIVDVCRESAVVAKVDVVVTAAACLSSPPSPTPPLVGVTTTTTLPPATGSSTRTPSREAAGVTGQEGQPRGNVQTGAGKMTMVGVTMVSAKSAVVDGVMMLVVTLVAVSRMTSADAVALMVSCVGMSAATEMSTWATKMAVVTAPMVNSTLPRPPTMGGRSATTTPMVMATLAPHSMTAADEVTGTTVAAMLMLTYAGATVTRMLFAGMLVMR